MDPQSTGFLTPTTVDYGQPPVLHKIKTEVNLQRWMRADRAGRIDAKKAAPPGVPGTGLDTQCMLKKFAKMGFNREDMIPVAFPTALEGFVFVKQIPPNLSIFDWDTQRVGMVKWKEAGTSRYTLFSASFTELLSRSSSTWYSLTNDKVTLVMLKTGDLPKGCSEW
ncbi:wsc domain containing protein [Moniliophthora roreri]|nr:wsc domain containing protein [Moniliophthora roreri]